MSRCECCDLPAYSCGRATEQRARADAARRAGELRACGYFPAQWPGDCGFCGERFQPGALIRLTTDTRHACWRAECCS